MKPRGVVCGEKSVQPLTASHRKSKYTQGIFHNRDANNHKDVLETGDQKSMIGMGVWYIIKIHDDFIDDHGVNLGGVSKGGRQLKFIDAIRMVKNHLYSQRYMIILRQAILILTHMRHYCWKKKIMSWSKGVLTS